MGNTSTPFPVGQTYFKGETVDTDAYEYVGFIGQTYAYKTGIGGGNVLSCIRVVKNSSGVALPGGKPVQLNANRTEIIGFGSSYGQKAAAVDGYLSDPVPDGDLCYVFEEGPALILTPDVLGAGNFASGDPLTAKTIAASTNATSAGFVKRLSSSNATDVMAYLDGTVARAISAATTDETDTLKAVFMDIKWS